MQVGPLSPSLGSAPDGDQGQPVSLYDAVRTPALRVTNTNPNPTDHRHCETLGFAQLTIAGVPQCLSLTASVVIND